MESSSISSNYGDLLTDLLTDSVKDIRKSAIMTQMSGELAVQTSVANDIIAGATYGGFEPDEYISEGSTISFHV